MAFSADAWTRNLPVYETIRTMPFNAALADGSLSVERFRHYMIQDAHYLVGFGRALAIAAAKSPTEDGIVALCEAAKEAIVVERALHGSFFLDWQVTPETFASTDVAPSAHHYVSWLVATAYSEPYEVVLAAVLPCFWIYAEVGRDILGRAATPNPYQAWIDTYAGEEFWEAVRAMIALTDAAAAAASPTMVAAMHRAYATASRLEYHFWDGAWQLERWKVPA